MPTQLYSFRASITEFIHWMQVWMERQKPLEISTTQSHVVVQEFPETSMMQVRVMLQALWLLNLAGVANSGVHEDMKLRVLSLMRDLARDNVTPEHALELLKGWEK